MPTLIPVEIGSKFDMLLKDTKKRISRLMAIVSRLFNLTYTLCAPYFSSLFLLTQTLAHAQSYEPRNSVRIGIIAHSLVRATS